MSRPHTEASLRPKHPKRSVLQGASGPMPRTRMPHSDNLIPPRRRPFSGGHADQTQCSERLLISARLYASLRSIRRIIAKKRLLRSGAEPSASSRRDETGQESTQVLLNVVLSYYFNY